MPATSSIALTNVHLKCRLHDVEYLLWVNVTMIVFFKKAEISMFFNIADLCRSYSVEKVDNLVSHTVVYLLTQITHYNLLLFPLLIDI